MKRLAIAISAGIVAVLYGHVLIYFVPILLAVVWYGGDLEEWLMMAELGFVGWWFFDNPATWLLVIPFAIVVTILSLGMDPYPPLPRR